MNSAEFDKIINTIQATYGHKISSDTRVVVWERSKHIPGKHVDAIVARLCDYETLPKAFNVGKAILDAYKVLDPQGSGLSGEDNGRWVNDCPECDPGLWKGQIVYFTRTSDGKIAKRIMPCACCQPNSVRKGTRATLIAQGFMVPPNQNEVTRWYWHMAKANNPDLFARLDGTYGSLLGDMGRMAKAADQGMRGPA